MELTEALSQGSLLLGIADVGVKCISEVDELCSDGQAACKALVRSVESRIEALW